VDFQAFVPGETRRVHEGSPHELDRLAVPAQPLVLLGEDFQKPDVSAIGVGGDSPLRPGQGVVVPSSRSVQFGDLDEVVGRGEIAGRDRNEFVQVAGLFGEALHDVGDVEPEGDVGDVEPEGGVLAIVSGLDGRHPGPDLLGQLPEDREPAFAQHVGVGGRGAVERLPVGVQLPLEEPSGEGLRIGSSLHAGSVMQVTQPLLDPAHVPVGVVDGAQGILEARQGVLAELDDLGGVSRIRRSSTESMTSSIPLEKSYMDRQSTNPCGFMTSSMAIR